MALCDLGAGDDAAAVVFSGCAPFAKKEVQNAGKAFFNKYEKLAGSESPEKEEAGRESGSGSESGDNMSPTKSGKKKKEKKEQDNVLKMPECLKGEDLYGLLEVAEGASQDELKKAFRKICLVYHPDKHGGKSEEEMEAVNLHFVKLQECFNVLSDVKKRRKYDSTGEFDDSVPSRLKEGQDFYEVFGEVFRRNAKWSEVKPVPELGGPETPYEKVKSFYNFWFDFESWRDLDELIVAEMGDDTFQDLEEADSRDEKRWMERENARVRSKYMKVERQRIFGFVELSEKTDPRVRAEKDKQFAEGEQKKAVKEAKRVEAERLAAEAEEKRAAEEEAERVAKAGEKAKREEEKQVRKVARGKLRKMVKDLEMGLAEGPLQEFLLALEPEETDKLMAQLAKGGKGEAVLGAMKAKGVEPVILSKAAAEEQDSTAEGSPSEEEVVLDPKEVARLERERLDKKRKHDKKMAEEKVKLDKIKEEEAVKRAEEKAVRDAKKKVEQEKKDKEQQKANKKEQDRIKREEEKKVTDAAKALEKAAKEKEANSKRSEEQRLKQKAENEADTAQRALENKTFEYERDRLARCDAFDKVDKIGWSAVVEAAKAAVDTPVVASGLAAIAEWSYEDPEELLDNQLQVMGSFFALGSQPPADALPLSSGLRSRVKKLRTKIRNAAAAGEFVLAPAEGSVPCSAEALEEMLQAGRGEAPLPAAAAAPEPEKVVEAVAEEAPKKAGKKAKGAKAPAEEEDLDALLSEFGVTVSDKKKKGGKKK